MTIRFGFLFIGSPFLELRLLWMVSGCLCLLCLPFSLNHSAPGSKSRRILLFAAVERRKQQPRLPCVFTLRLKSARLYLICAFLLPVGLVERPVPPKFGLKVLVLCYAFFNFLAGTCRLDTCLVTKENILRHRPRLRDAPVSPTDWAIRERRHSDIRPATRHSRPRPKAAKFNPAPRRGPPCQVPLLDPLLPSALCRPWAPLLAVRARICALRRQLGGPRATAVAAVAAAVSAAAFVAVVAVAAVAVTAIITAGTFGGGGGSGGNSCVSVRSTGTGSAQKDSCRGFFVAFATLNSTIPPVCVRAPSPTQKSQPATDAPFVRG